QADVRKLQLAKAAVAAGIETLLHDAGLDPGAVAALHLAGGFGSYLQPRPAAGIGLIPVALVDRTEPAGNTALTGAVLLTLSRAARRTAEERALGAREVALSTHPVFMDRYIESMGFRDDIEH
ncbi:MAG: ASKHA domain-containing protein, partial [Propionicimonas sp.]